MIIRIAYNTEADIFRLLDDGSTIETYPWYWSLDKKKGPVVVELLSPFLESLGGKKRWTYCNQSWGGLDQETGEYFGAVGEVT